MSDANGNTGGGVDNNGGGWEPTPQGEYDADATAFVQIPEGFGLADFEEGGSTTPLAAPGGYVPPQISVTGGAATDPAATSAFVVPTMGSGQPAPETVSWPEPNAAQPPAPEYGQGGYAHDPYAHDPYGQGEYGQGQDQYGQGQYGQEQYVQDPYGQGDFGGYAGQEPTAYQDPSLYAPQAPAGYPQDPSGYGDQPQPPVGAYETQAQGFTGYAPQDPSAYADPAAGQANVTGQWSIPLAQGELPDESGEFTQSSLIEQWGSEAPATLPGGAAAPWASVPEPEPEPAVEPESVVEPEPVIEPEPVLEPEPVPVESPAETTAELGIVRDVDLPSAEAAAPVTDDVEETPDDGVAAEAAPDVEVPVAGVPVAEVPVAEVSAPEVPDVEGELAVESAESVDGAEPAEAEPEVAAEPESVVEPELDAEPAAEAEVEAEAASVPETDPASEAGPEAAPDAAPQQAPAVSNVQEQPAVPHDEHPLASYVLRVNGVDRPVTDAWIGESLLYVLRERLGLAGAKDGCSQGECGACAVQVDGRLVASCLVPAATTAGSEVRTVEGLAVDGRPSDVQRALACGSAVQCGFCVPGMAMTVHDLLEGNPDPTERETRQALCGNLCRCTGYHGVLDAVREVVAERRASAAADAAAEGELADGGAELTDVEAGVRIPQQAPPGAGGAHPQYDPQYDPQDGGPA